MRKTKLFGWILGIALCACMVLWMPVSADAADSVATECTHEWVDGTCSACGEACAHASFDDNGFCTVCDFGQPAVDADGDGYVDIANSGNLYWFRYAVNIQKNYSLNAELTADIVINENVNVSDGRRTWNSIGGSAGYSGIFDGNGYSISGIYSNAGGALFGEVRKGGIIRNVGIIDCYITSKLASTGSPAASIAYRIDSTSKVENCYSIGGDITGRYEVGGIVAWCSGTVMNCYNTSVVRGYYGADTLGGIVGELSVSGSILNCYSTGKILCGFWGWERGGIVGYNYMDAGKVDNCYYLNTVCGTGIGGADSAGKADSMTAEQFASGEVAYLLGDVFGQTVGTDALPVLGGQKVYKGTNCKNEIVYSNTELNGEHQWVNDFCTVCGVRNYQGWTQIDGDWYYYDPETNEPLTGIVRVPYPTDSINGIAYGPNAEDVAYYENKGQTFIDKNSALFVFDENGVFQSDLNGLTGDNRWASNGCIVWHIGLVRAGEDFYYFLGDAVNGGNRMATGDVHVGRNTTDLSVVLGGVYTFGEDGKLCKYDGIVDLRYYESYRLMQGNGLTKAGDNYIYVNSFGELIVDAEYYVPGNDLGIASGVYTFDESGFMVKPVFGDKDGVYFENGAWYYYENGKIGYNKGMMAYGDGYIYVRSSGKLATGSYYITNVPAELSGLFRVGQKVIFDDNGMTCAPKHGIVDGYYYQFGAVVYNAGLTEVNGKWIYVRSNGQVATGMYWITNTNGAMEPGCYEFGADGYMIISEIEDGIVAEGENLYYYRDGRKQYGLGLEKLEDGSYIYVRTNGELAVGSYWITNHNGLLPEGMYEFGQDGILTAN